MPQFTEIVDSQTDNVTSKNTIYTNCGVVGTSEASKPIRPSVAEMQRSQADGAKLPKSDSSETNDNQSNEYKE